MLLLLFVRRVLLLDFRHHLLNHLLNHQSLMDPNLRFVEIHLGRRFGFFKPLTIDRLLQYVPSGLIHCHERVHEGANTRIKPAVQPMENAFHRFVCSIHHILRT